MTAPDSPGGSVSAGAVPPRPKNASGRSTLREDAVKTLSPERPKNGAGANGSSNGASPNGAAENGNAAPQAFTSSSALNGHANGSATAARKKRKKR